jgi:phenylalanyl-tRNA synthetase alpha chain
MDKLEEIQRLALEDARQAQASHDMLRIRSEYLGKKGHLGMALRGLGDLPAAERPKAGEKINAVKERIEAAFLDAEKRIANQRYADDLLKGRFDVTLPGRRVVPGARHPLRLIEDEIISCLRDLGFRLAEGPLVEHDWYNFEALNFPAEHPARDMQDTFFVSPNVVLRTHTSNVQIRTMMQQKPPVRIIAPGMVFRHDEVDATHSPVFHQVEGLWIDAHATFADLKGVLRHLVHALFGSHVEVRFRPSFFPFTEPSVEVDMRWGNRWLEILGAGMVDPAVLATVGYNPEEVQGFAFGIGIERVAILRYGIDDIRSFYENDVRFLKQFQSI